MTTALAAPRRRLNADLARQFAPTAVLIALVVAVSLKKDDFLSVDSLRTRRTRPVSAAHSPVVPSRPPACVSRN